MDGRIVLFGATGYTGRMVARELAAHGASPLLAGRSQERLEELAAEIGGAETAVADVSRPETVRALAGVGDVLISTVGPFARFGDAAAEAAVAAGAFYLDSTGEPAFIRRVFDHFGPRASDSGAALVTAFGYDWLPGNLAGALALRDAGEAATGVEIGYFVTGGSLGASGGTLASSAGAMLEQSFAWRGGRLAGERSAKRVGSFDVDGRRLQGVSVGSSEHFALPRLHPGLREVDVYLGWFGPMSRAIQAISAGSSAVMRLPGVRRAAGAAVGRFVKGSTGGPSEEELAKLGSHVVAIARGPSGEALAEARLVGVDGYTFTARALAWGAMRAAEAGMHGTGALGPAEAFGLDELEAGCAEAGIRRV